MKDDIDMSLTEEILKALPENEVDAMTSEELFNVCKGAETITQIAKLLSALRIPNKIHRRQGSGGKKQFWLAKKTAETLEVAPVIAANSTFSETLDALTHNSGLPTATIVRESTPKNADKPVKNTDKPVFVPEFLKVKNDAPAAAEEKVIISKNLAELILSNGPTETPPLEAEYVPSKEKYEYEPYKVAITNHNTLIIFGIWLSPIELTPEQTQVLVDFIDKHGDLSGAVR